MVNYSAGTAIMPPVFVCECQGITAAQETVRRHAHIVQHVIACLCVLVVETFACGKSR